MLHLLNNVVLQKMLSLHDAERVALHFIFYETFSMITLVFISNDQCLPLEIDKCVTIKPRVKTRFLQQLG